MELPPPREAFLWRRKFKFHAHPAKLGQPAKQLEPQGEIREINHLDQMFA
jgi:hypothetical protein